MRVLITSTVTRKVCEWRAKNARRTREETEMPLGREETRHLLATVVSCNELAQGVTSSTRSEGGSQPGVGSRTSVSSFGGSVRTPRRGDDGVDHVGEDPQHTGDRAIGVPVRDVIDEATLDTDGEISGESSGEIGGEGGGGGGGESEHDDEHAHAQALQNATTFRAPFDNAFAPIRPLVPFVTCSCACALWLGCAIADATRFGCVADCAGARELTGPLLLAAIALALSTVALLFLAWKSRRFDAGWRMCSTDVNVRARSSTSILACAVLVVAMTLLGGGLRCNQTLERSRLPAIHVAREGMLVTIEATIASEFIRHSMGSDILARHFDKPPRYQGLLRDIVFVDDDGSRRQLDHDGRAMLWISVMTEPPPWRVTERVRLVGVLRGEHDESTPTRTHAPDATLRFGVVGSIALESPALGEMLVDHRSTTPLADALERARATTRASLRSGLLCGVPAGESNAVPSMLVALVLGDAEDGYRMVESAFRAVGLSHILAISGFNLAVLGWIVAASSSLVLRHDRHRAIPVALAALAALMVMAPAASAMRAALMAIVGACAAIRSREWNGDGVIAIAAIIMLVHDPSIATNAGFQLSFGCVLALRHLAPLLRERWLTMFAQDKYRRGSSPWIGLIGEFSSRAIAAGLAAFLASIPIALAHFGTLHPMGTLLTFLCTPLATVTLLIAYPKAIFGSMCPDALSWIVSWLGPVVWLPAWLQIQLVECSMIDRGLGIGGALTVGAISSIIALVMVLLMVCALALPRRTWRSGAWIAFIALPISSIALTRTNAVTQASQREFVITMLAIGDGSVYLVDGDSSTALFDCGSSTHGSIASRNLIPAIEARGGRVDTVFISHPNLDHYSALLDVLRQTRVRRLVVHDSFLAAATSMPAVAELLAGARKCGTEIVTVAAGDTLDVAGARWNVLWPPAGFRSKRENDLSLVMRVDVFETPRVRGDGASNESVVVDHSIESDADREVVRKVVRKVVRNVEGDADHEVTRAVEREADHEPDRGRAPPRARILFCGDIETEPAARLSAQARAGAIDIDCDIFELPHHGSWRPAVVDLITAVSPSVIMQSTAARRFANDSFAPHVHADTLRFVTCRDGSVRMRVTEDGTISCEQFDPNAKGQWRMAGARVATAVTRGESHGESHGESRGESRGESSRLHNESDAHTRDKAGKEEHQRAAPKQPVSPGYRFDSYDDAPGAASNSARSTNTRSPTEPLPPSLTRTVSVDASAALHDNTIEARRCVASSTMVCVVDEDTVEDDPPVTPADNCTVISTRASAGAGSANATVVENTMCELSARIDCGIANDASALPVISMVARPSALSARDSIRTARSTPYWNAPSGTRNTGVAHDASGSQRVASATNPTGSAARLSAVEFGRALSRSGSLNSNDQPASAEKARPRPRTRDPSIVHISAPEGCGASIMVNATAPTRSTGILRTTSFDPVDAVLSALSVAATESRAS